MVANPPAGLTLEALWAAFLEVVRVDGEGYACLSYANLTPETEAILEAASDRGSGGRPGEA